MHGADDDRGIVDFIVQYLTRRTAPDQMRGRVALLEIREVVVGFDGTALAKIQNELRLGCGSTTLGILPAVGWTGPIGGSRCTWSSPLYI
jgi:hypothetical protein